MHSKGEFWFLARKLSKHTTSALSRQPNHSKTNFMQQTFRRSSRSFNSFSTIPSPFVKSKIFRTRFHNSPENFPPVYERLGWSHTDLHPNTNPFDLEETLGTKANTIKHFQLRSRLSHSDATIEASSFVKLPNVIDLGKLLDIPRKVSEARRGDEMEIGSAKILLNL